MSNAHHNEANSYGRHVWIAWEIVEWLYKLITVCGAVLVLAVSGAIRPMARQCSLVEKIVLCLVSFVLMLILTRILLRKWNAHFDFTWKSVAILFGGIFFFIAFLSSAGALVYAQWFDNISDGDSGSIRYLIVTEHELRGQRSFPEFDRYFAPTAVIEQHSPPPNVQVWRGIGNSETPGSIMHVYSTDGFQAMFYRKNFIRVPAFESHKKFVVVVTQTQYREPKDKAWSDDLFEYWVFRLTSGGWRIFELHGGLSVEEAVRRYNEAIGSP